MSLIDGTVECEKRLSSEGISFQQLDPLKITYQEKVERLSLIDGSLEEITVRVILPFPPLVILNEEARGGK